MRAFFVGRTRIPAVSYKEWRQSVESDKINNNASPTIYSFGQNSSVKNPVNVQCTVSRSKAKFLSGTIERDCIIYTTRDGAKFFFPKDLNIDKQTMTPSMAVSVWNELPESLRALSQKKIVFLDIYNPEDNYWIIEREYKNFDHAYATGGREIIFLAI